MKITPKQAGTDEMIGREESKSIPKPSILQDPQKVKVGCVIIVVIILLILAVYKMGCAPANDETTTAETTTAVETVDDTTAPVSEETVTEASAEETPTDEAPTDEAPAEDEEVETPPTTPR